MVSKNQIAIFSKMANYRPYSLVFSIYLTYSKYFYIFHFFEKKHCKFYFAVPAEAYLIKVEPFI